ncbi:MAG TPA: hypothetical protein VGA22_10850 [Gemmatimonadales bacterium]|jgi:hypothetical protein
MRRRGPTVGLLLLLVACDPGDVILLAPDETSTGAPPVSIHVVIDTPYVAVASSLGWTAGVPGAQVRVHRMDEPYDASYWRVATADSTGVAAFADLLYGLYEVAVTRPLSPPEMVQADSALRLLAGGRRLWLPTPDAQDVMMAPNHRGSLVFSELGLPEPLPWETGGTNYPDAKYFEVYNHSDTTIYLDGKYWGIGWIYLTDATFRPCSQTQVVRNDPEGLWTEWIFRFPGSGTDYPLAPGETALVAKAAIDHRAVHPGLYDLRDADFEWGGRADNPDVPNLEDIGVRPMYWYLPLPGEMPEFLSDPVDLETLPRYVDPYSGSLFVRIPRASVLDVWAGLLDWSTEGVPHLSVQCLEYVHRFFEGLPGPPAGALDFNDGVSYQRRVLTALPDGRKVLQDTETSMVDFVKALRTPGSIPDSLPPESH